MGDNSPPKFLLSHFSPQSQSSSSRSPSLSPDFADDEHQRRLAAARTPSSKVNDHAFIPIALICLCRLHPHRPHLPLLQPLPANDLAEAEFSDIFDSAPSPGESCGEEELKQELKELFGAGEQLELHSLFGDLGPDPAEIAVLTEYEAPGGSVEQRRALIDRLQDATGLPAPPSAITWRSDAVRVYFSSRGATLGHTQASHSSPLFGSQLGGCRLTRNKNLHPTASSSMSGGTEGSATCCLTATCSHCQDLVPS